jgi:hypothetical protein
MARGYYEPWIEVETNTAGSVMKSITGSACSCVKGHVGTICTHRAALLMFFHLNTVLGFAGSPTDRENYWMARGGNVLGEEANVVMRTVDVLTNRLNHPKVKELMEMEKMRKQVHPSKRRRVQPRGAEDSCDSDSEPDSGDEVDLAEVEEAKLAKSLVENTNSMRLRVRAQIDKHSPPLVSGENKIRGAIADAKMAEKIVELGLRNPFIRRLSRKADVAAAAGDALRGCKTAHPVHGVYNALDF